MGAIVTRTNVACANVSVAVVPCSYFGLETGLEFDNMQKNKKKQSKLSEYMYYTIFTFVQSFYSGSIFTVLRPEKLSRSLLGWSLLVLKILGLNPELSMQKGEIVGYVIHHNRAHWAQTALTFRPIFN